LTTEQQKHLATLTREEDKKLPLIKVIQMGKYHPSFLYKRQVLADHYSSAARSFHHNTYLCGKKKKVKLVYDERDFI